MADAQQKTSLYRTIRVGDALSFDNGRVVVRLEEHGGRRARLHLHLNPDVKVDKPPKKPVT